MALLAGLTLPSSLQYVTLFCTKYKVHQFAPDLTVVREMITSTKLRPWAANSLTVLLPSPNDQGHNMALFQAHTDLPLPSPPSPRCVGQNTPRIRAGQHRQNTMKDLEVSITLAWDGSSDISGLLSVRLWR